MSKSDQGKVKYLLDKSGRFVINEYNYSKPFSNFFPGVSGEWGIPMWVFYVNRGQCVTSFGIEGKDKAILEFQPANKAYRCTSLSGFRTFLKIKSGKKSLYWEPFQNTPEYDVTHNMHMQSHDLTIEEVNHSLGLAVRVNYFTLPEEPYAALVRRVSVINLGRKRWDIEMIDGLPAINPYGVKDWLSKNLSRTVEAWMKVRNLENKAPYYHLNVEVADTPQVQHIKEGNFFFSFTDDGGKAKLLKPIVESAVVFGSAVDFRVPEKFWQKGAFSVPKIQQTSNRTPCAMNHQQFSLGSRATHETTSVFGFAYSVDQLNDCVKSLTTSGKIEEKQQANKDIVDGVKNFALTNSSSDDFNMYSQQTFLDNVLRGGLPISLKTGEGPVVFNVYSRKHGDLERDYNYFTLAPTFFSQGNGNFRDVNQNRRNDIWFNTDVKDTSIINFLSLSQPDGYNPLVVKGLSFTVNDPQKTENLISKYVGKGDKEELRDLLNGGFQPGVLLNFILHGNIEITTSPKEFLSKVLEVSHKNEESDHGEGFWTDHWTYNTDLLESYLSVYPEELRSILLDQKVFSFYYNNHYVLPRDQRYILTSNGVRQYHSVFEDPKIKAKEAGNKLRIQNGAGGVYLTNLLGKYLCIIANKAASLDPSGIGVEMEADKPNWYDALNGLPGLIGSSINETFELKRIAQFLLDAITKLQIKDEHKTPIFTELYTFITRISHVLTVQQDALKYWETSNEVKEHYRYRVRDGIEGKEDELSILEIKTFLKAVIAKTDKGTQAAKDSKGLYATYFYHEVVDYVKLDKEFAEGVPYVRPKKFKKKVLPLFLEGPVHGLRCCKTVAQARGIYQKVRKSGLYDKKLKMYKVNTDLSRETEEIGRTRIFPSGWLENESVWLHMEYKFFLELIRAELYEEFYDNFKNALVPFLNAKTYGRSTLENSSFIVSSSHEDPNLHGQGFVARLSGSTAEFLHIWLLMNVGKQPFRLEKDGALSLTFEPALAGSLFTKKASTFEYFDLKGRRREVKLSKDTYAFNFMGKTLVVYHNPKHKNTYGTNRVKIKRVELTYPERNDPVVIKSSVIPSPYAHEVRDHEVERVDVYFN